VLLVLDQRELPGRMSIVSLAQPSEVSSAIRSGAINGGPILGEIAAYSIWLAAGRAREAELQALDQQVRAAANTLRTPRPDAHALRAAVNRMEAVFDQVTSDGAKGEGVAEALRAEADLIAQSSQVAHSALGRVGAMAFTGDQPVNMLMHGDMGPLSSGMVGTGTAIVNTLMAAGRSVHVWLTEAAPSTEGARVAALQLTQMDVPHTVIADTAVAWLFASRHVDAALLRGDTVAANGDTLSLIGSLNVATLATAADVPVLIVAPSTSFDEESADARGLVLDLRSVAESFAAQAEAGSQRPAVFGVRLNPQVDVVPRGLVSGYVTESGARPGGRA
jgi:methylthioribose-1-phosphate isomerase